MTQSPRTTVDLGNIPQNFIDRLEAVELFQRELQIAEDPQLEELTQGRVSVFDLGLSPAEGVVVTDPQSTAYTGFFVAGNGIDFDGNSYVSGNVINGVLKTGFTTLGTLYAQDAVISGTVIIGAGSEAGGWFIDATAIYNDGIVFESSIPAILIGDATDIMAGAGVFIGDDSGTYKMRIGDPAANYLLWDGSTLSASGQWIRSAGMNPALQQFETNIVFTSASDVQVNWTAGTIALSDGTTYTISSGNTGTMSALTYIYLDIAVSLTVLQITTTYSTAVGDGKILVAAAQNATAGASVLPMAGQQPIINGGAQITALSILAGNIAAGAITASKISVTSLSAITATMGSLTIDSTLTMSGASGAITIGTTPPTSSVAGTGLWIDRTGVYSLDANVRQATLSSAGLTAGAGDVIIDDQGISIVADGFLLGANAFKMVDTSGLLLGVMNGSFSATNKYARFGIPASGTRHALTYVSSVSSNDAEVSIDADSSWYIPVTKLRVLQTFSGGKRVQIDAADFLAMEETSADPPYIDNYMQLYYLDTGVVKIRHKQGATETELILGAGGGGGNAIYMDGADGAVDFDGANTFLFATLSGSTYTLKRNIYCTDMDVQSGITLLPDGFVIYGNGTLTNDGTIHFNGANASGSSAGTAPASNVRPLPVGLAGGAGVGIGAAAAAGSIGAQGSNSLMISFGGRGASAFLTATTHQGRAGGLFSQHPGSTNNNLGGTRLYKNWVMLTTKPIALINIGAGGGGGGKSAVGTSCQSGGGGASGNAVLIIFKDIINTGTISANGGNGGNATGTAANAGGGGGGSGGVVHLVYNSLDDTGTISAAGGNGGTSIALGTTPLKATAVTVINSTSLNGNDIALAPATDGIIASKNTLYLLSTHQQGGTLANPTITGWGLTWNLLEWVDFNSIAVPTRRITLWYAYGTPVLDPDNLDVVVHFPNTPTTARAQIDEIQNATNTIVQTENAYVDSATTLTVTLPNAFGSANAAAYAVFARSAGTLPVAGAGFVLITQGVTPALVSELSYNDTTLNMTHTTAAAVCGIGIEIQAIGAMESGQSGYDGQVVLTPNA